MMKTKEKRCEHCGAPLKGKQRRWCSSLCWSRHRQGINKDRRCVVCGAPLGKYKQKYCSTKCLNKENNRKRTERGYWTKRYHEQWAKKGKVCYVCGKKLVLPQRKYCSYKCYIINKNKLNTNMFEKDKVLELYHPLICDECGSQVIQMNDGVYCCSKCGLVY